MEILEIRDEEAKAILLDLIALDLAENQNTEKGE